MQIVNQHRAGRHAPLDIRGGMSSEPGAPSDAVYVGLAEALDCPLLTADRRLADAPGPRCEIRLLNP
jgi:hypothetical protein